MVNDRLRPRRAAGAAGVAGCSRHPTDVRPSRADGPRAEAARWIAAASAAREGRMPRPDVVASCGVRPGRCPGQSASAGRPGVAVGRGARDEVVGHADGAADGTMRARCTTWRVHVLSLPFAGDRPERCAGRILENVALYSPGTGTYAATDNVVKSDRRSHRRVRSHGNSPISGLLRMVAVSRSRTGPGKFANRFGAGSVARDSSSGACAPPHRTAATAHLRTRSPRRRATWPAVREPNHGGS